MSTNGKTLKFRAAKLKGFTVYDYYCFINPHAFGICVSTSTCQMHVN